MLNYTAIDFETANGYRGSPCAVGLVRVRNGQPVAEARWLMRPPEPVGHFDPFNTFVHGITAEMVANEPRWNEILPRLLDFIGDDVVVAHNAGFDIGVIRYACAADNIEWPEMQFLCTLVLARRALSLPSYRLPFVVEALGKKIDLHHDPVADARAVVDIVAGLATANGADNLESLAESSGVRIGRIRGGLYVGSVAKYSGGGLSRLAQAELNPNADPDGYLYGRVVVFTGALMTMTRQAAWDECARVGAISEKTTTKRTNVLVVGDINPAVLRPGAALTKKAERAFELQDQGQDIEVMTEDDFLRCLEGSPLDLVLGLEDQQDEALLVGDIPAHLSKVTTAYRPTPPPLKPPRPLRREPVPTEQHCCVDGCPNTAAFRTRTKPTWCEEHIVELQRIGGIKPLEPFTHPDDWQLTECLTCTIQAHYRFNYTLDKTRVNEPTCRACYWREWAKWARGVQGEWAHVEPVPYEEAKAVAEENGFDYLGPLTAPSLPDDPHHTRCRRCGKIGAERLGDISFGCTCSRS